MIVDRARVTNRALRAPRQATKETREPEGNTALVGIGYLRKRDGRNCDRADHSWADSPGKCQLDFHLLILHGNRQALAIEIRP